MLRSKELAEYMTENSFSRHLCLVKTLTFIFFKHKMTWTADNC